MRRKRKLDKWVTSFVDRSGKERFRFRRDRVSIYLPPPGSEEYRRAYKRAVGGTGGEDEAEEGTVNGLAIRFYRTIKFRSASPSWQRTMRQTIDEFRDKHGRYKVTDFKPWHIDRIIADKFDKKDGRGGSAAARRLRDLLMRLFALAVKLEWIAANPVEKSEVVEHEGPGFRPWTEADISQFRAHWEIGTKARLAMELMLWTAIRRSDAHMMPPPVGGMFHWKAAKTGKAIELPVMEPLQKVIDATPHGKVALIETEHGKPFSRAGFGNKMREWCDAAGLPHCTAHGLRKAATRRAAEAGVPQQGMKALGQWSQDREVATYAKSADDRRMAADALNKIVEWERTGNNG